MRQWLLTLLLKSVTRFEVIDNTGRVYSKWNLSNGLGVCRLEASLQDKNRTLKVFIDYEQN